MFGRINFLSKLRASMPVKFSAKFALLEQAPVISQSPCCLAAWSFGPCHHDVRTIHMVTCGKEMDACSSSMCEPASSILRHLSLQKRGMAGHSKWQNIRHIKAAKDAQKSKMASKITQKLRIAVKEGGGTDPKYNFYLARVLEEGKANDIPNSTMEQTLRRLEKTKDEGSQVYMEAKGPGNFMLIIDTFTDKAGRTRQAIASVMNKFGGKLGASGLASHAFEMKGCIYVPVSDKKVTLDEATEIAIEAGAEEVQFSEADILQFICDCKELHAVKKSLEAMNYSAVAARLEYVPHNFTSLNETNLELASQLFDKLEELEEVTRIYDNIEVPQDS